MSWNQRGSGRYYYRSRREGKRVFREYYGRGPAALAVAELDAAERDQQKAPAAQEAAERKRFEEADSLVNQWIATARLVQKAVLVSEGFYQHQRGEWRRRKCYHV